MMGLQIQIAGGRTRFRGGQEISGEVSWELPVAPREVVLELLWTTRGKGTVDTAIVESIRFPKPPAKDEQPFRLRLPESPVSFTGKLVSLNWYLRVLAKPSNEQTQLKLIISPTGEEIELARIGG